MKKLWLFVVLILFLNAGDVASLEATLIENEQDHPTRLSLAKAYYELGMYEESQYHFTQVLGYNIPEEVKSNILIYLAAIDEATKKESFGAMIQLSSGYDTNINSHPGAVVLSSFVTALYNLDPSSIETGDILQDGYTAEVATLQYKHDIGRKGYWMADAGLSLYNQNHLHNTAYDFLYSSIEGAMSYTNDNLLVRLPLHYGWMFYDGYTPFMHTLITTPSVSAMSDVGVFTVLLPIKSKFFVRSASRNAYTLGVGGEYKNRFVWGDWQLGGGYEYERSWSVAVDSFVDFDKIALSTQYATPSWAGFRVLAEGRVAKTYYQDTVVTTTSDNRREDTMWVYQGGVEYGLGRLNATALYTSTQNLSTYTPTNYNKRLIHMSLAYLF